MEGTRKRVRTLHMMQTQPETSSLHRWLRRFWPVYCLLVALAVFAHTRFDPYQIDGDAVSYMDIGDLIRSHQWAGVVNGYWHPLYPAALALSHSLFHSTRFNELNAYYMVNFVIFLLEMLAIVAFSDAAIQLRDTRAALTDGGNPAPFLLTRYPLRYLGLALLVIAFLGQKIVEKLGIASDPYGWFKRTLGALFLVVGLAIFFGQDKIIEAKLLESGVFDITKVEQVLLRNVSPKSPLETVSQTIPHNVASSTTPSLYIPSEKERVMAKSQLYPKAPELVHPSGFVNTDGKPITLAQYKGKKVVLIDVWTYSCINCQRTLPYVKAWYDKYKDQGLEIVGLHTPEFSFEKVQKNVEDAVKRDGITYPVVLDNDYATWNAYGNQYWPRKYLVDIDGFIVYDHIGEGNYDETEKAIQKALGDRAQALGVSLVSTFLTF